jgi:PIN domain nuclease of toxin-antitoxin system
MRILLDTHALLWLTENPKLLSVNANAAINSDDTCLVSHASIWELSIKLGTGKLKIKRPLQEYVELAISKHLLESLPIDLTHIYQTQLLPLYYRDPFDRLLIAQALSENIAIVSSDAIFDSYGVKRIW